MNKNMILSTTDVLQDYTIDDYEGYISASSTIGTGLMTDVLSSWTDVLGIKSRMIENKLQIIRQEVIKKLIEKATKLRCNAIIGLQIDVDEISSNQKMIFMVTACGTAVKCRKKDNTDHAFRISGDYLKKRLNDVDHYIAELHSLRNSFENNEPTALEEFSALTEVLLDADYYDQIEHAFIDCLIAAALNKENINLINVNIIEIFNNFQSERLCYAFLDIMLALSEDKNKILQIRKTASYTSIFDCLSSAISFSAIYDYMSKGNDFFSVIVVYPLLLTFKDFYEEKDSVEIKNIITKLKERYWNECIDISPLDNQSRICVCGQLIKNGAKCSCGETATISLNTFKEKQTVIKQLTKLYNELLTMFSNIN